MLRINKTRFYVGEKVIIEGKITPPPANKNIQLVRYYYCKSQGKWFRASDIWDRCDDKGYFKIEYKAEVEDADYCKIGRGEVQRWEVVVRYQPYRGAPPEMFGSLKYEVINKGVPVAKVSSVIGRYKGRRAILYPPYDTLEVEYGATFRLEVTVENSGAEPGKLWCRLLDEEGEELTSATSDIVRQGDLVEFDFDVVMPRTKSLTLKIEVGHFEDSKRVVDDSVKIHVVGVEPATPKARIVDVRYPSEAEPGEDVIVEATVRNEGAAGVIFADIIDLDTGEPLAADTKDFYSGEVDTFKLTFKMPNKTLKARLRVGHYVGELPKPA